MIHSMNVVTCIFCSVCRKNAKESKMGSRSRLPLEPAQITEPSSRMDVEQDERRAGWRPSARRRLWKRSLPLRKRKKRRTTAPAMQSEPRSPDPGLNVPEPGGAADWSGSGGRAIQHPRHVTGCCGPNRLGCHILERQRGKPFLFGDRAGTGSVIAKWGDLALVAVYASPNISRTEYASFLNGLATCVRRLGACPSLVLGDFNAHSTAWGSRRTNGRGRDVQDWTAALDLRFMNRGSTSTCVAWQGRVHSGPHVGKSSRFPPCFLMGRVPGGDPLGPPLHFDGGGG